ncbi:g3279 [Coccomyxa elongata]
MRTRHQAAEEGTSNSNEEQAPLLDAAGSASPETRATSKQAKTTKGKAASGKSHAGAPKRDTKRQQEVQPRKRRKGGVIASKSAEPDVAEGATAGASVDAEALETNAALQVSPKGADRPGSAPLLAAEAEEAAHVEAGEEDDEDEAPEEVSMAAGRAGAAAARREEREMAAHQKRLAKEKGRKRAALAEADRDARLAAQQPGPGTTSTAEVSNQEEVEEEEGEDDFLPAAVIEAVKRSREARAADLETDGVEQQQAAAGKPRKRGNPSQPKKLGPFLVQPLSSLPDKKASESAQQFVRQRMFGAGVKRSAEMLIPSTASLPSLGTSYRRRSVKLRGFGDELLDYITAGPKLRKWYGEGERMPVDGGMSDESDKVNAEPEDEGLRDAILVTDADNPTAEQIILQLILSRAKIRALAKNATATSTAYGSYVTPVEGNTGNTRALEAALRGVRAVICTGRLGDLLPLCQQKKVEHLILLTSVGSSGSAGFSLDALMDGEAAAQRDAAREAAAVSSGVPLTLVRVGRIANVAGGCTRLLVSQEDAAGKPLGAVSREDVARVLVKCLDRQPSGIFSFSLEAGGPLQLGSVEQLDADMDLAEQLARLRTLPVATVE